MLIDVEGGWIELARPSDDGGAPDLLLEVTARIDGFQGFVEVWVETAAWADFVHALTQLEATRRGAATIESISPGELTLTLRSTDAAGHMTASGQLRRDGAEAKLSMAFGPCALDPSLLPELVRLSRQLAKRH
ncbi:MAG: hypothetical protein JJ863_09755 [Deltaproteobacteria bacterium]|nr:hypothetical protein [Deltaproteobacteria bacterium]